MTNLLITAGVLIALTVVAYLMFNNKNKSQSTQTPSYTPEELENIKLAEELYNKDLRPIVTKKANPVVAQELNVVEPQFVAKVVDIAKVLPPDATINAEALGEVKQSKPEFPIDKPKKRRKHYPKAPKANT